MNKIECQKIKLKAVIKFMEKCHKVDEMAFCQFNQSINQSRSRCVNQLNLLEHKNNKPTTTINQFLYLEFNFVAFVMHRLLVQFCIPLESVQVPLQYRHYRLIVISSIDLIGNAKAHTMYSTLDTIN